MIRKIGWSVRFSEVPPKEDRDLLKGLGFRYSSGLWAKPIENEEQFQAEFEALKPLLGQVFTSVRVAEVEFTERGTPFEAWDLPAEGSPEREWAARVYHAEKEAFTRRRTS
jgi:hypothetical protein